MDNLHFYFTPTKAFILYEADKKQSYIQIHEIFADESGYQLGAGMSVTDDDLDEIARQFNQLKDVQPMSLRGLIPSGLLHFKGTEKKYSIIWWIPSRAQYLHFSGGMGLQSGMYLLPGLVFKATHELIEVYAHCEANFNIAKPNVTLGTQLYVPPIFNTSKDGDVCMGDTKLTGASHFVEDNIVAWERAFFGSKFTHLTEGNDMIREINVIHWYKMLANDKHWGTDIATKYLIPLDKTVEDLIDE